MLSTTSRENSTKERILCLEGILFCFNLNSCALGFEHLKYLYKDEYDLGELSEVCQSYSKGEFLVQDGHLFKGSQLHVLRRPTQELMSREIHGGSLARQFGEDKTYMTAKEHYY